jgi:catechol 2,3-dioxygenase-like lactoylglutathione lyase family enzyme
MDTTELESIVMALDHIQLAMSEGKEELADRFYCKILGFRKLQKPAHLEGRGGRWFHSNGVNLHLGIEREFVPARKAHPVFVVRSLSELKTRLDEANIEIVWDTQIQGFEHFYTSDPFGNRLEFMERLNSEATT